MNTSEPTIGNRDIHAQVIHYCDLGLQPVPIVFGTKHPLTEDWPKLQVWRDNVTEYFNDVNQNVGIRLGQVADLDSDCLEAIAAAVLLAPETNWVFGRLSKPDSHRIYIIEEPLIIEQYRDPTDKSMIVELRCLKKDGATGHQTVVPPSIHESGERVDWSGDADPSKPPQMASVSVLRTVVKLIAATALLAKHFPKAGAGRHNFMLAFAGTLARGGISLDDAMTICVTTYQSVLTHDPDVLDRIRGEVADSYERFAEKKPPHRTHNSHRNDGRAGR